MGTKEFVAVPFQLHCSCRGRGEHFADRRRNHWHGQTSAQAATSAEPSPFPVAPWGELELWSSSLVPVLGVLWGSGLPTANVP